MFHPTDRRDSSHVRTSNLEEPAQSTEDLPKRNDKHGVEERKENL